jgi:hypothetical protein
VAAVAAAAVAAAVSKTQIFFNAKANYENKSNQKMVGSHADFPGGWRART